MILGLPLFLAWGYLCGSIPFGLILTKVFLKQDIRTIGSGNIGTTNVLRTGNKKLAIATLILDAGKGVIAIFLLSGFGPLSLGEPIDPAVPDWFMLSIPLAVGLGAILGHCFPIWLKFKGGKGVATGLGIFLAATPSVGLIACASWIISAFLFKISSLAALLAFTVAPIATLFIYGSIPSAICTIISLVIFFRHKDNIKRLLKGEEPKIGKKKKDQQTDEPASE